MALCGESGEIIEFVKKHLSHGTELNREEVTYELGNIAWYLDETSWAIGYSLEGIMIMNIYKLKKGYLEGLI